MGWGTFEMISAQGLKILSSAYKGAHKMEIMDINSGAVEFESIACNFGFSYCPYALHNFKSSL